ncbi:Ankyrin_repeat-containing protein [Hexamita inflata]|uniref:Ankyrin repeat-containing protein n=1 Tax=Hexamita inflata TaxID=28002 RepID=A0AA86QUW9_9EUKA|nr:Ankyrin repeat-containing protein [Hexamita inflata]
MGCQAIELKTIDNTVIKESKRVHSQSGPRTPPYHSTQQSSTNETPLQQAITHNYQDEVSDEQYLEYVKIQNVQKIEEQLIYKAYRYFSDKTALMIASELNLLESVRILSEKEQKLTDSKGDTALMHAVRKNNVQIVPFLTKELKMKNYKRQTAQEIGQVSNCVETTNAIKDLIAKMDPKPKMETKVIVIK